MPVRGRSRKAGIRTRRFKKKANKKRIKGRGKNSEIVSGNVCVFIFGWICSFRFCCSGSFFAHNFEDFPSGVGRESRYGALCCVVLYSQNPYIDWMCSFVCFAHFTSNILTAIFSTTSNGLFNFKGKSDEKVSTARQFSLMYQSPKALRLNIKKTYQSIW